MPESDYKIRIPQLKMLRDLIDRNNGDVNEAVRVFVAHYVHEEKKDVDFWTPIAQSLKDDPKYVEKYIAEQKKPASVVPET